LQLPVRLIEPNPNNPRRVSADDALAASIRRWGQLQPVVVRQIGHDYQLVCGERRWRAHLRAGLPTIWAVEREASDLEALAVSLAENMQRVALSHAEKVAALDQLAEVAHVQGLRRTARELHMDPSWLSRQLAIRTDPEIFAALEEGRLGFGQAAEVQRAPKKDRSALLKRVVRADGGVTTATIRLWVDELRAAGGQHRSARGRVTSDGMDLRESPFVVLLRQLREVGPPRTRNDRDALCELLHAAELLLGSDAAAVQPQSVGKVVSTEIKCLMCGERVGEVGPGGGFRPRAEKSVRRIQRRLVCGRCGGSLETGDRGERYHY
jgi:ParB/RepB/Spo0J family partition protein